MDKYYCWAKLPNMPNKLWWPVEVNSENFENEIQMKINVYCKSDNAE